MSNNSVVVNGVTIQDPGMAARMNQRAEAMQDMTPGEPVVRKIPTPVETPVQTVRVVYNPNSIDSCLAATIIAERVMESNPKSTVLSISVDYVSHDTVRGKADILAICGVSVDDKTFLHEIALCDPSHIVRFSYLKQEICKALPQNGGRYVVIDPANIANMGEPVEHVEGEEVIHAENSISFLANEYFYRELKLGREATPEQKRLMRIVSNYTNFKKFDGIWERDPDTNKVTKREDNDLAFLYRNVRGIRRAASMGTHHVIPMTGTEDVSEYTDEIARIRKIINRNRSERRFTTTPQFAGGTNSCYVNIVAVGEDDSLEVMRQLRHSFPVAATYEDTADARIWRIMTSDVRTLAILKDVLDPVRSWTDCQVIYFACELPKLNENIK